MCIRDRAEMSHAASMFEKGRVFDLRSLSRGGLSQNVCDADVAVKNGSATSTFGQLSVKARSSTSEAATNGHVPFSKMLSSGDGQRSGHSALNFLERFWVSRSQTPSALKLHPGETDVWTHDHKSGGTSGSASANSRRWSAAWRGIVALGAVFHWLAAKLTSPSDTAVCTKSTSTGDDSPPPADAWSDKRLSAAVSSCESAPCVSVDDHDYVMVTHKPDNKTHVRREKSANDHVYSSGSCEPPSKTGYFPLCTFLYSVHVRTNY